MSQWIKSEWLKDEVGPGVRGTRVAGGSIPAYSVVLASTDAKVVVGTADSEVVLGVLVSDEDVIAADEVTVAFAGECLVVADSKIVKGDLLKSGTAGRAMPALTSVNDGVTIKAAVGLAFGNQPANDGLEIGSSSTADTMPVTVYGTTNGGLVVVAETVVLTGTTFVSTVKTDWGVILGFEIPEGYPTAAGTITVREASANATVSTMLTGVRQKGVANVAVSAGNAYNRIVTVEAEGASTKVVGLIGETAAGVTQRVAITLAGAVAQPSLVAFKNITKVLTGDLESSRTLTVKTATVLDKSSLIFAQALADADAFDTVPVKLGAHPTTDVAKPFSILPIQTIDMADAQVALVHTVAIAGQKRLSGQILLVDANSAGTEDLLLPPESTSAGLWLLITNTGGEDIVLKDDGDAVTIATISTAESAFAVCDGVSWSGGVVKAT